MKKGIFSVILVIGLLVFGAVVFAAGNGYNNGWTQGPAWCQQQAGYGPGYHYQRVAPGNGNFQAGNRQAMSYRNGNGSTGWRRVFHPRWNGRGVWGGGCR